MSVALKPSSKTIAKANKEMMIITRATTIVLMMKRKISQNGKENFDDRGDDDGKSGEHDDVIKWKHFPRYWPFVRGIHRSPVNSPHKGQ